MRNNRSKGITILSLVCAGVLMVTPVSSAILNSKKVKEEANTNRISEKIVIDDQVRSKLSAQSKFIEEGRADNIHDNEDLPNSANEVKELNAKENRTNKVENQQKVKINNDFTLQDNMLEVDKVDNKKSEDIDNQLEDNNPADYGNMSIEQAKEKLFKIDNTVDYVHMGNASEFEALHGRNGQVFLPDVQTDMGYFVDSDSNNVYYFHPSGYMEKVN